MAEATSTFSIRPMTLAEVDLALDWAAAEGWNPGLRDAAPFYHSDPAGFLLGILDSEPIGSISVVRYSNTFGFLGFYMVRSPWRGQGYGIQLWKAGLAHLGNRNIGLDGVVAQVENYQRFGFRTAYRHIRHQGIGSHHPPDLRIQDLRDVTFSALKEYDDRHFPVPRPTFLTAWVNTYPGYVAIQGGEVVGYGVVRETRQGYKVGPLFADTPDFADQLWRVLATHAVDAPIFLDTPDANPAAIALAQSYAMTPVFECARMYTQSVPLLPIGEIFGVTTLELG